MNSRTQTENMWGQGNKPVVLVNGFMINCYTYGHIAKFDTMNSKTIVFYSLIRLKIAIYPFGEN